MTENRPPAPPGFRYFDSDGLEVDPTYREDGPKNCPICRAPWNCVLEHTPHEPICDCIGAWTQTVHEINAEGHQVGCPRWGIRQRPGNLFGPPADEAAEIEGSQPAAVREIREVPHWPHRGSDVEAWLKAKRDSCGTREQRLRDAPLNYTWHVLDNLLDEYRLRADVGATLDAPVEELGP